MPSSTDSWLPQPGPCQTCNEGCNSEQPTCRLSISVPEEGLQLRHLSPGMFQAPAQLLQGPPQPGLSGRDDSALIRRAFICMPSSGSVQCGDRQSAPAGVCSAVAVLAQTCGELAGLWGLQHVVPVMGHAASAMGMRGKQRSNIGSSLGSNFAHVGRSMHADHNMHAASNQQARLHAAHAVAAGPGCSASCCLSPQRSRSVSASMPALLRWDQGPT